MHSPTKRNVLQQQQQQQQQQLRTGLAAYYDSRPGNGACLFSKENIVREEISKKKVKKKG